MGHLCVWAPQYLSAGTSSSPNVSRSILIFPDCKLSTTSVLDVGWTDHDGKGIREEPLLLVRLSSRDQMELRGTEVTCEIPRVYDMTSRASVPFDAPAAGTSSSAFCKAKRREINQEKQEEIIYGEAKGVDAV